MSLNKLLLSKSLFFILSGITVTNAQSNMNTNQNLTTEQEHIAIISALTATGKLEDLATQLNKGLDAGLTVEETKEIIVQLYAYCGFPRSLNGISTLMGVMEKRKAAGIQDKQGKVSTAQNGAEDNYEKGRKVLEQLTNTPQSKPAPGFGEFAPRIDRFLKEHLFADIFESDVLTFQQREIVTIAALSSMSGVVPQLEAHVKMGGNSGITDDQLGAIALVIEKFIGKMQADTLVLAIAKSSVPNSKQR